MKKKLLSIIIFSLLFSSAQAQVNAGDWIAVQGKIEEKEFLGRKALYLNRGIAFLPVSDFKDGVIETDIAGALMAGLTFRIDVDLDYEEVYLRPVKSGGGDAIQYGPVYNGEFSWQFYPEYQAKASYPQNEWLHLKVVVKNEQAAVYVLNQDKPSLLIDSLRIKKSGKVGIWSLSTGAYFSNFTYRPLSAGDTLSPIPVRNRYNEKAIRQWQISGATPFTQPPPAQIPSTLVSSQLWQPANTEPDGYLNINRFVKKAIPGMGLQNSEDMVWLRYEWNESQSGLRPFSFEYSNKVFVFCNGTKTFEGNNSFFLKGEFFRGDIDKKMQANKLFLPVKKGRNELLFAVAAKGNGWGLMAQFGD